MQEQFIRKTMKRIAAIGTGVAMVGATLTGAMALDLKDYPAPFVVGGVYDDSNALVVGDNADAADTLGLVDISSELQYESKVAVSTGSSGTVSVTGGKSDSIPLGLGLSNATTSGDFDKTLQHDDISNLFDGTIDFKGTSYDTSEELSITQANSPVPQTGLTSSDTDYGSDVYLEVLARKDIKFNYKFDQSINLRAATTTDPVVIDFLGNPIKITSVDSAGAKFTAYVGEEDYLTAGQSVDVVIDGVTKTVTLTDVSSTSAVVDVDGQSVIINSGSTETVNGVEVTVDSVFSRTEISESSANLIIGKQSSETYSDGDAFIGEDTNDPNWVWILQGLDQNGTSMNLSVGNDFVSNDIGSGAAAVGDCISLPNDYVQICLDSLTVADTDYSDYTMELDTSADFSDSFGSGNSSDTAIHFSTSETDGIQLKAYSAGANSYPNVTSDVKTKDVWLYTPGESNFYVNGSTTAGDSNVNDSKFIGVFYKDSSSSKIKFFGEVDSQSFGTEILRINYGNTKDTNIVLRTGATGAVSGNGANISLAFNVTSDNTGALANGNDNIVVSWGLAAANTTFAELGNTKSTEEAGELKWSNPLVNIGTKDEDERTAYGIIVKHPKSNGASDQVVLSIPQDQVKANIVIKGTSSTTTSSGTTYQAVAVTPVTKLASEVGTPSDYNLILVGGPCANSLVETLFGYTCDGWTFQEGEAVVKLVANGDKVAMLVAGTTADDTRRAAKAVANYASYSFSGTEAMVSGTSLTDITVASSSQ